MIKDVMQNMISIEIIHFSILVMYISEDSAQCLLARNKHYIIVMNSGYNLPL